MREALPKDWNRAFKEGEEIDPKDFLDMPIPGKFKDVTDPVTKKIIKRGSDISRREVLQKGIGAGAALAAGAAGKMLIGSTPFENKKGGVPGTIDNSAGTESSREIEPATRTITIQTGAMAGRKVGDLFAFYLGLEPGSVVPRELTVNFGEVLEDLWDKKITRVGKQKKENDLWIENMRKNGREIFYGVYAEKWNTGNIETYSMPEVIKKADSIISELNASLAWSQLNTLKWKDAEGNGYAPFTDLNDRAVSIVKDISERITGEMLIAYSITELMPSLTDGEENVDEYSLLLKYAGAEFLNGAPALGDPYLSAGPFQFTSFAVYDANGEQKGASIINKLLPKDLKIPGSVSKLVTLDDQIRAAHLFAIHNIALLVKRILADTNRDRARERLITFIENKDHQPALLQYIASAHHAPGHAIPAFNAWLDVGMRGSHAVHAKADMPAYIKKSYLNLKALQKMHPQK
jgi:hypothetical protein